MSQCAYCGLSNHKLTAVFISAIYSHKISPEQAFHVRYECVDDDNVLFPDYFRASILRFGSQVQDPKSARAIIFRSFAFAFLILPKKAPEKYLSDFKNAYLRGKGNAIEIKSNRTTYQVTATWSAYEAIWGHFWMHEQDYQEPYFHFKMQQSQKSER